VTWPAMIALAGSMAFAVLMLITRSLRATPDIVLASTQFLGTLIFGILLAPFGWITPTWGSLGFFIASGAISVVRAALRQPLAQARAASTVAPYQYSMIIWAVMFGYVVFGDVPSVRRSQARRSSSARGFTSSCANAIWGAGRRWSVRRCRMLGKYYRRPGQANEVRASRDP